MDSEYLKIFPKISIGRAEDLTNKIFGKWRVLYRTTNDNSGKAMWVCECQCDKHTTKPVSARTLKAHTSTNCGCERLKTIANLADIKIHIRDEQGNIIKKKCFRCKQWLPLSDFWKNVAQKDGYSGECKQCQTSSVEGRYNIYKKNARKRNIDFNLTFQDFKTLTSQPCSYCGDSQGLIGIDRIDSQKGYNKNNCTPACKYCNLMKLDYDLDFWLKHMEQILNYQKEKNKYAKEI